MLQLVSTARKSWVIFPLKTRNCSIPEKDFLTYWPLFTFWFLLSPFQFPSQWTNSI